MTYLDLFDAYIEVQGDLKAHDGCREVEAEPSLPVVIPVLK